MSSRPIYNKAIYNKANYKTNHHAGKPHHAHCSVCSTVFLNKTVRLAYG